jgi:hypothetical protein
MSVIQLQHAIEYLVSRKYPAAKRSCPIDPELRRKAEAFREELHALSEAEVLGMYELEQKTEQQQTQMRLQLEESQCPFNQPIARKPDYSYWAKVDLWTLDEGIALLLGREPEHATWKVIEPYTNVSSLAKEFRRVRELALRSVDLGQVAVAIGRLGWTNIPPLFLAWAKNKDLAVPTVLEAEVSKHARNWIDQEVINNQLHESIAHLSKEIASRDKRIAELEAELAAVRSAPTKWPWGNHTTPLLEALAAGGRRFWQNYDRTDSTTAETNEVVKSWLVKEHQIAERVAEVMAQILRDPDIPTGPRK